MPALSDEESQTAAELLARPVVLFDFDGTLVDTAPFIMRTCGEVLAEYGFTREEMGDLGRLVGPPLVDGFRDIYRLTQERAEEIVARYRERFDTEATPDAYPVMPGARELLGFLQGQGRTLAIATSRREEPCKEMAAAQGLDRYFAVISGLVEPIRHTKADSIAYALEAVGASPEDALMVGDRYHDVEGAHELGLPCIGLDAGAAAPGELEEAGAELVLGGAVELLELYKQSASRPGAR